MGSIPVSAVVVEPFYFSFQPQTVATHNSSGLFTLGHGLPARACLS
jgi:hypothetical protein